jgi:hypothetical protein
VTLVRGPASRLCYPKGSPFRVTVQTRSRACNASVVQIGGGVVRFGTERNPLTDSLRMCSTPNPWVRCWRLVAPTCPSECRLRSSFDDWMGRPLVLAGHYRSRCRLYLSGCSYAGWIWLCPNVDIGDGILRTLWMQRHQGGIWLTGLAVSYMGYVCNKKYARNACSDACG